MQRGEDTDGGARQIAQNQEPVRLAGTVADISRKRGHDDGRQIVYQQRKAEVQAGTCLRQDVPAQGEGKQFCACMGHALAQQKQDSIIHYVFLLLYTCVQPGISLQNTEKIST